MKKFFAAILLSLVLCPLSLLTGCGDENYERSEKMMGTLVTLKASGGNSKAAVDKSFDELFKLVENVKVDVKNLNDSAGSGEFVKVSPEVFDMLKLSQKYSELTGGAFDVTCGAAVDLWRTARKNKVLPAPEDIDAVKNLVGYQHLHLKEMEQSAMIDLAGVKINLGGVGKGYGVDIVRKIFSEHGITDGLIDFGTSSIFAFGKKKIGIKNPRNDNELAQIIELENCALSTSGDYEQFFIVDGRRYHHIINPKTCLPTDNGIASVSVIVSGNVKSCGAIADILSTAILVLGEENSKEFLKDSPTQSVIIKEIFMHFVDKIE